MELPERTADEDQELRRLILERIVAEGSLSFADYMAMCLYQPGHGYYVACDPTRDFRSSPNVHPLFAALLARQLAELWELLERPPRFDVFEAGASSGRLAIDLLTALARSEPACFAATRYRVQDVSHASRPPQAFSDASDELTSRLSVVAELPDEPAITGCILSNELLDAIPFQRVRARDGQLLELRVGARDGRFVEVEAEAPPELFAYFDALGLRPGEGCDAEVSLGAPAWVGRAARALRRGYLLTLDYGYDAAELYAPWRKGGTLLTFYHLGAGDDPFVRVGRQDITASVDFTTVRRAGEAAGLRTLGLTSQAEFLARLGTGEALSRRPEPDQLEAYFGLRWAAVELTDPSNLGRIRVLLQGRDAPATAPRGFAVGAPG